MEEKPLYLSETFFQSTKSLKVLLSATFNPLLEIRDHIPDAQEPMPLLSGTLKMEAEPELDSHQAQEKLSLEVVELPLVLLLVEEEMKNQS